MLAGRYRIVAPLGAGGAGEVYRAEDTKLGQTVALKFISSRVAHEKALLERIISEVRIGRQVSHPVCTASTTWQTSAISTSSRWSTSTVRTWRRFSNV